MTDISICIREYGTVRFSQVFLEKLVAFQQLSPTASEAGGVVLGEFYDEDEKLVFFDLTEPQPQDLRHRHSFFRSSQHNTLTQKIWKNSGQKRTYVGLWHTHPELRPKPSNCDLHDWNLALKTSVYDGNNLFFMILGQETLGVWLGSRHPISISKVGELSIER